eukprot:COSAG01_NODE_38660_length_486_cov_18.059432_1_plen_88_part_00
MTVRPVLCTCTRVPTSCCLPPALDDRMNCLFCIVPRDQQTRRGATEEKIKIVFSDLKWQGSGYAAQSVEIEHDADSDNVETARANCA